MGPWTGVTGMPVIDGTPDWPKRVKIAAARPHPSHSILEVVPARRFSRAIQRSRVVKG